MSKRVQIQESCYYELLLQINNATRVMLYVDATCVNLTLDYADIINCYGFSSPAQDTMKSFQVRSPLWQIDPSSIPQGNKMIL